MMCNPRYFKEKICEELEGSSHYLKKAIDEVKTHPEWSKTFAHLESSTLKAISD